MSDLCWEDTLDDFEDEDDFLTEEDEVTQKLREFGLDEEDLDFDDFEEEDELWEDDDEWD